MQSACFWGFSTVKIWVIWKNMAESATLPPPLNLIYWTVLQARERERERVRREEVREEEKKIEAEKMKQRGGGAIWREMAKQDGRRARRDMERKRRRKAAGDRFIRGEEQEGEMESKRKDGEGRSGFSGGVETESAHPLSANCCSLMDRPPLPHPAAPCCLFHPPPLAPYSPSHPAFYLRLHQHRNTNCCDLTAKEEDWSGGTSAPI